MPEPQNLERGEGERMHAQLRRRFWLLIGGLALIGAIIGFVGGLVGERLDSSGGEIPASLQWLGVAGIAIAALLAIYGCRRFFASVDELELADNLWGSLIGFYAYAILLPAWWAFSKLGLAPEPDQWVIYFSSFAVALIAYAWRKIRLR